MLFAVSIQPKLKLNQGSRLLHLPRLGMRLLPDILPLPLPLLQFSYIKRDATHITAGKITIASGHSHRKQTAHPFAPRSFVGFTYLKELGSV
jgi:hypothetical protein